MNTEKQIIADLYNEPLNAQKPIVTNLFDDPFNHAEEIRAQTNLLRLINAKLTFFTVVLVAGILLLIAAEIYRY